MRWLGVGMAVPVVLSMLGCGIFGGMNSTPIITATLAVEQTSEGPERTQILAELDDAWLQMENLGQSELGPWTAEIQTACQDGTISAEELAELTALRERVGIESPYTAVHGPEREARLADKGQRVQAAAR